MGSEKMLVTPDNTPAKMAKNRRYEVQMRFLIKVDVAELPPVGWSQF